MASRAVRGVRAAVVTVIVLGLLGVSLVVADGVVEQTVEERTARQVQVSLGAGDQPLVDITGRPFLPQLASQRLGQVTVHSGPTTLATGPDVLTVERLDLTVADVTSSDWFTTSTAGRLDGSADVGYPEISRLAGYDVRPGEVTPAGTRWSVTQQTSVLGVDVPLEVSGLPVLEGAYGRQLTLTDVQLNVAGYDVPEGLASTLTETVVQPVPLELPMGLGADTLASTEQGMTLSFSGEDVALS